MIDASRRLATVEAVLLQREDSLGRLHKETLKRFLISVGWKPQDMRCCVWRSPEGSLIIYDLSDTSSLWNFLGLLARAQHTDPVLLLTDLLLEQEARCSISVTVPT